MESSKFHETCAEGKVFCPESSVCIDNWTPCGEKCLSLQYPKLVKVNGNPYDKINCTSCDADEWQCGFDCVKKEEACNETCTFGYNFCHAYFKCIEATSPCEDKCLSITHPVLDYDYDVINITNYIKYNFLSSLFVIAFVICYLLLSFYQIKSFLFTLSFLMSCLVLSCHTI